MKEVTIHTDGACSGNPGVGGWAAILQYKGEKKAVSGGESHTTNNRMELQAAIEGLQTLKEPCHVTIFTDSSYLRDGISKWVHRWKENGWRTAGKNPVKNQDLWVRLLDAAKMHRVDWRWLKGHNGNPLNEECDRLAREKIIDIRKKKRAS